MSKVRDWVQFCPRCKKLVGNEDTVCPHCGIQFELFDEFAASNLESQGKVNYVPGILILFTTFFLGWFLSSTADAVNDLMVYVAVFLFVALLICITGLDASNNSRYRIGYISFTRRDDPIIITSLLIYIFIMEGFLDNLIIPVISSLFILLALYLRKPVKLFIKHNKN